MIEIGINRINELNLVEIGKNKSKDISELAIEFLKKLAIFYYDENIKPSPPAVSDIVNKLGYNIKVDIESHLKKEVLEFLEKDISKKYVIEFYLKLLLLVNKESKFKNYLSVYESLIKILEIGGDFTIELKELKLHGVGVITLNTWYTKYLEVNIDG